MRDARLIWLASLVRLLQLRFLRSFVAVVHRRRQRQIKYRRNCVIGRHVAERRINHLPIIEGPHEHVGVRDLARQQMQERLLSSCHRCGTRQGVGLSSVLAWAVLALFKSRPGKRSPETRCASGRFSAVRSRVASNGAPARALHLPWCTAPISRRIHASRRPDRLSRASQGRCGHVAA
jgi:hypothetical protein